MNKNTTTINSGKPHGTASLWIQVRSKLSMCFGFICWGQIAVHEVFGDRLWCIHKSQTWIWLIQIWYGKLNPWYVMMQNHVLVNLNSSEIPKRGQSIQLVHLMFVKFANKNLWLRSADLQVALCTSQVAPARPSVPRHRFFFVMGGTPIGWFVSKFGWFGGTPNLRNPHKYAFGYININHLQGMVIANPRRSSTTGMAWLWELLWARKTWEFDINPWFPGDIPNRWWWSLKSTLGAATSLQCSSRHSCAWFELDVIATGCLYHCSRDISPYVFHLFPQKWTG